MAQHPILIQKGLSSQEFLTHHTNKAHSIVWLHCIRATLIDHVTDALAQNHRCHRKISTISYFIFTAPKPSPVPGKLALFLLIWQKKNVPGQESSPPPEFFQLAIFRIKDKQPSSKSQTIYTLHKNTRIVIHSDGFDYSHPMPLQVSNNSCSSLGAGIAPAAKMDQLLFLQYARTALGIFVIRATATI